MSTKKIENIKTSFFVSIEQIEEMGLQKFLIPGKTEIFSSEGYERGILHEHVKDEKRDFYTYKTDRNGIYHATRRVDGIWITKEITPSDIIATLHFNTQD